MRTYKQQIRIDRAKRLEVLLALVANEQIKSGWRGGPVAATIRTRWWFRWKTELKKLRACEAAQEAASG